MYFYDTLSITYKMIVTKDNEFFSKEDICLSAFSLSSDELILLAGMPIGTENWHSEQEQSSMKHQASEVEITNLCLESNGKLSLKEKELKNDLSVKEENPFETYSDTFLEVSLRYKRALSQSSSLPSSNKVSDNNKKDYVIDNSTYYTLIDIWENIEDTNGAANINSFSKMDAPEIISHIQQKHRTELIGLLTLYPYEWRYRDARTFKHICGENIAIDSDDLVLVSQNVCTVFGTYGLRGKNSPTNWVSVLRQSRSDYGISWPQYQYILDIALSKKYAINSTLQKLQKSAYKIKDINKDLIRNNSELSIEITRIITSLDAVKFSRYTSYKLMYEEIEQRLRIQKDLDLLTSTLSKFDSAMKTIDSINEAQRSRKMTLLLACVAIFGALQVTWLNLDIPIVDYILHEKPLQSQTIHYSQQLSAIILVIGTLFIIVAIISIILEFS